MLARVNQDGRVDSKSYLYIPSCSEGVVEFLVQRDNTSTSQDLARFIGLNLLQPSTRQPLDAYDQEKIEKMQSDVCVMYNGEMLYSVVPTSKALTRGIYDPILYFERKDIWRDNETMPQCKNYTATVQDLAHINVPLIQVCSQVPYPMTSIIAFYDDVQP